SCVAGLSKERTTNRHKILMDANGLESWMKARRARQSATPPRERRRLLRARPIPSMLGREYCISCRGPARDPVVGGAEQRRSAHRLQWRGSTEPGEPLGWIRAAALHGPAVHHDAARHRGASALYPALVGEEPDQAPARVRAGAADSRALRAPTA